MPVALLDLEQVGELALEVAKVAEAGESVGVGLRLELARSLPSAKVTMSRPSTAGDAALDAGAARGTASRARRRAVRRAATQEG